MKLSSVWISGFKSFKEKDSIKDRAPFLIDEKVTVLIGANDHGKSNVLEAVLRLNDDSLITEEDKNWDLPDGSEPRIEWQFTLDSKEIEDLQALTPKTRPEIPPATSPLKEGDFPPSVATSVDEIINPEFNPLPISEKKNTLTYMCEGIGTSVSVLSAPFEIEKKYESVLLAKRPRVELFEIPPNDNVVDTIEKAQLDDTTDKNHEFIKGLFITADIWDMREKLFGDTERAAKQIEIASKQLTKVMQEKWAQNDGSIWKFRQSSAGPNTLNVRLQDKAVKDVDVPPSRKSSGFRSFFLLSMMITARIYDSKDKPHIFLFDEPGTFLHPRAQIDLQRSFEKMAEEAQIAYTTHSLFLVSKNYPERNRVISKTIEGTKIDQKPFISNWKSVRNSLGIVMSNNFLIADKSILFEGPSDQFYLYNAIRKLKTNGVDIDLNDFSSVDGGDSANYLAMTKVLIEEGRSILCIADGDKSGKDILKGVRSVQKDEVKKKERYLEKHPDEQVIPNPDVEQLLLGAGKSIEDIFADMDLLIEAISTVADNLVSLKIRHYVDDFSLDDGIKNINDATNKTLGAIIDEETKKWFTDNKKLSKLSIALEYDRLAHSKDYVVSSEAKRLVKKIKKTLNLKGEKSIGRGVFAEV